MYCFNVMVFMIPIAGWDVILYMTVDRRVYGSSSTFPLEKVVNTKHKGHSAAEIKCVSNFTENG